MQNTVLTSFCCDFVMTPTLPLPDPLDKTILYPLLRKLRQLLPLLLFSSDYIIRECAAEYILTNPCRILYSPHFAMILLWRRRSLSLLLWINQFTIHCSKNCGNCFLYCCSSGFIIRECAAQYIDANPCRILYSPHFAVLLSLRQRSRSLLRWIIWYCCGADAPTPSSVG